MLLQGVRGVLVVSWWRRVGGVEAVVLVVGLLCLGSVSWRVTRILKFFLFVTVRQVVSTVPMLTIMIADDEDDDEDDDDDGDSM